MNIMNLQLFLFTYLFVISTNCFVTGAKKNGSKPKTTIIDTNVESYTVPVDIVVDSKQENEGVGNTDNIKDSGLRSSSSNLEPTINNDYGVVQSDQNSNIGRLEEKEESKDRKKKNNKRTKTQKTPQILMNNEQTNHSQIELVPKKKVEILSRVGNKTDEISGFLEAVQRLLKAKEELNTKNETSLKYKGSGESTVFHEENLNTDTKNKDLKSTILDNIKVNGESASGKDRSGSSENTNIDIRTEPSFFEEKTNKFMDSVIYIEPNPDITNYANPNINVANADVETEISTIKSYEDETLGSKASDEILNEEDKTNTNSYYVQENKIKWTTASTDFPFFSARRKMSDGNSDVMLDTKMRSGGQLAAEAVVDFKSLPPDKTIKTLGERISVAEIYPKIKMIDPNIHDPFAINSLGRGYNSKIFQTASAIPIMNLFEDEITNDYDGDDLTYPKVIDEYEADVTKNAYLFVPSRRTKPKVTTQKPLPKLRSSNFDAIFAKLAQATQRPVNSISRYPVQYPNSRLFNSNYAIPDSYNPFSLLRRKRYTTGIKKLEGVNFIIIQ